MRHGAPSSLVRLVINRFWHFTPTPWPQFEEIIKHEARTSMWSGRTPTSFSLLTPSLGWLFKSLWKTELKPMIYWLHSKSSWCLVCVTCKACITTSTWPVNTSANSWRGFWEHSSPVFWVTVVLRKPDIMAEGRRYLDLRAVDSHLVCQMLAFQIINSFPRMPLLTLRDSRT